MVPHRAVLLLPDRFAVSSVTMSPRTTLTALLISLWLTAAPTQAGPIKYYVDQQFSGGSVTGFIETDGTLGTDILLPVTNFNLVLTDGSLVTDATPPEIVFSTQRRLGSETTPVVCTFYRTRKFQRLRSIVSTAVWAGGILVPRPCRGVSECQSVLR